nr:gliding motility-associated C-terminal domain-containing protein [uncultured Psychroserpens sp.]
MKISTRFSIKKTTFFILLFFLFFVSQITYAQCIGPVGDCDNDGVLDINDFDDDNDGILDTNEDECNLADYSDGGTRGFGQNLNFSTDVIMDLLDYNPVIDFVSAQGGAWDTYNYEDNFTSVDGSTGNQGIWLVDTGVPALTPSVVTLNFGAPLQHPLRFEVGDLDSSGEQVTFITDNGSNVSFSNLQSLVVSPGTNIIQTTVFTGPDIDHDNNSGSALVHIEAGVTSVQISMTVASSGSIGVSLYNGCTPNDTDHDGTPDYLDTDSDNDGCPDALEADGGFTYIDLEVNGSFVNVVDVNGIPQVGGLSAQQNDISSQDSNFSGPECDDDRDGVQNSADVCNGFDDTADADGDLVPDACDDDDDNDGLLDTDENGSITNTPPACGSESSLNFSSIPTEESGDGNSATFLQGEVFRIASVLPNVDAIVTIQNIQNCTIGALDDNTGNTASFTPLTDYQNLLIGDVAYVEYNFSFVSSIDGTPSQIAEFFVNFNDIDGNTSLQEKNWTQYPQSYTAENPTTLTFNDEGGWFIATSGTINFTGSTNAVPEVNFSGRFVNLSSFNFRVGAQITETPIVFTQRRSNLEFSCISNYNNPETTELDYDEDGIPNSLDTDSDNDGCPDAIEGDGGFTFNDLDADGSLGDVVTNNGNGVPDVVAATGQNDLSSQNSDAGGPECDDDNDGVSNNADICNGFDDNADADGDTIPDGCDEDDDNDGILDVDENGPPINTQPACGEEFSLDFSAIPTEESGDGNSATFLQGEVFRFASVLPNVDAIITIQDIQNCVIGALDDNTENAASFTPLTNYQNLSTNDIAYVEYHFDFVSSIDGTPFEVPEFFVNFNDIDGNTSLQEKIWTQYPQSYTIENPTSLTFNDEGGWFISTSGLTNFTGSTNAVPVINFSGRFVNLSSLNVRVGAQITENLIGLVQRTNDLEFSCISNYTNPETTELDYDEDGIPNSLDTDSDNDGCPDAIEADGGFTLADLDADDSLGDVVTNNGNGVPDVVAAIGQNNVSAYDETVISPECPSPSIIAEKSATITDNGDGVLGVGDTINYTITVENTGNTILDGVTIVDTLTDADGNVLSLTTGPIFDSADQGSAEGLLLVDETATYFASYVITQEDVDAGGVSNTILASGDSPDDTTVTDDSDDPNDTDNVDPDNDGDPDDPTDTLINEDPSIIAEKIATITDDGDGVLGAGDTINYTITVENTGNVTLDGVTITDTLTDADGNVLTLTTGPTFDSADQGSAEGVLLVDETATYFATYVITQNDVDAGGVSNTVLASGDSPDDTTVTDDSDDPNDTDNVDPDNDGDPDDPTDTLINEDPSIIAEKSATITDNGDGILGAGDIINYTITVENTGNVTLDGVTITDTLTNFDGTVLTLTSGPTFSGSDQGSAEGILLVDETATYLATYLITTSDVNTGGISNTVLASGDSPDDTTVTDDSDDPNDTENVDPDNDGDPDDPTDTVFNVPSIIAEKSATITDNGDGVLGVGDTINYTITVENTGNVTLDGVTITDTLTDLDGNVLTLTTGPTFNGADAGSLEGILLVGETATYIATYVITQEDVDAGGVSNTVLASGDSPDDTTVTDDSDDPNDTDNVDPDNDGDPDDPTDTLINEDPSIIAEKSASITDDGDGVLGAGDTINYTITVENTGNVTLDGVTIIDTLTDADGNVLTLTTGPTFDSADQGSAEGILLVDETATYFATYVITQNDVDAGGVSNTVLASGNSPDDTTVTDDSDDPNDTDNVDPDNDGDPDDPTDTLINEDPIIIAEKSATITDNGDGVLGAGDTISYTITVENTGNVTLDGVTITDTLTDLDGNVLTLTTGPTFNGADAGSLEGILLVGETATYLATYVITASDVTAGGVSNTVLASGDSPDDTNVTDVSDDPNDTDNVDPDNDGDPDDPTDTLINPNALLDVVKVADVLDNGDGVIGVGDVITYTITVSNAGNLTLSNVMIVDTFTNANGVSLTLDSGPTYVSSSLGSAEGDLLVGETATYTATYTITQNDVDAGGVINSVVATGDDTDGNSITDTSDDGDDEDGNTEDDPTETLTDSDFELSVTKELDIAEPIIGDEVTFTITIANDGFVTATGVVVEEVIPSGYTFVSVLTTQGTYSDSDGEWIVGQLNPGQAEVLQITVEVLGFGEYLNTATIIDYEGGDDQNEDNNTDTAGVDPICLTIYNEFSPNGDGVNDFFNIDCIETFPNNTLEIYNRWGNIVYEAKGYRNDFEGTSNGRAVLSEGEKLPVGTYYYVIDLGNGSEPRVGWLYINR